MYLLYNYNIFLYIILDLLFNYIIVYFSLFLLYCLEKTLPSGEPSLRVSRVLPLLDSFPLFILLLFFPVLFSFLLLLFMILVAVSRLLVSISEVSLRFNSGRLLQSFSSCSLSRPFARFSVRSLSSLISLFSSLSPVNPSYVAPWAPFLRGSLLFYILICSSPCSAPL